ncbi:hypothetical protein QOT17_006170 [Balamuthia mandrillaris]
MVIVPDGNSLANADKARFHQLGNESRSGELDLTPALKYLMLHGANAQQEEEIYKDKYAKDWATYFVLAGIDANPIPGNLTANARSRITKGCEIVKKFDPRAQTGTGLAHNMMVLLGGKKPQQRKQRGGYEAKPMLGKTKPSLQYDFSVDNVIKQLQRLGATWKNGNHSKKLWKEIDSGFDMLRKKGVLTAEEHSMAFNELLGIKDISLKVALFWNEQHCLTLATNWNGLLFSLQGLALLSKI